MPPPLIVAIGDSTTAGSPGFRSPLEAPPHGSGDITSQFAYWLMQQHPEWRVLNRGVDGERSDQIHARFVRDAIDPRPDAIILIAGVNDIYQGLLPEAVEHELEIMYQLAYGAAHSVIPVIAGSILPYDTATEVQNQRMRAVNDWIRDHALRHSHLTFCDTRGAVAQRGQPDRLSSSPDGLHPSAEGYRLMATALEPVVSRVLHRVAGH